MNKYLTPQLYLYTVGIECFCAGNITTFWLIKCVVFLFFCYDIITLLPMDKLVESSKYSVWSVCLQNVYVWPWRQIYKYFMLLQMPVEKVLFFHIFEIYRGFNVSYE